MNEIIMDIDTPIGRLVIEKNGEDYISLCNGMEVQTTPCPEKAMRWLSEVTYNMGYMIENMKQKGIEIIH